MTGDRSLSLVLTRRSFLAGASLASFARVSRAADDYPGPVRGHPRLGQAAVTGRLQRSHAEDALVPRARLPMLAMDGSVVPPPPEPPPVGPARPQWDEAALLQVAYRHETTELLAALTIDDGWYERDRFLDVLKLHGAHATLFVLGAVLERNPAFVSRALNEGHEFGNHTYGHSDAAAAQASGTLALQLAKAEAALKGVDPRAQLRPYFRPPGGRSNPEVVRLAAANGYRTILWSVDPQDWRVPLSPARVVPQTAPGAIVLNHFTRATADHLGEVIVELKAKEGIRFVTLSELFAN